MKLFFLFCAFGCLGVTVEVFFTALSELFDKRSSIQTKTRLMGHSYIWMFPIYGGGVLLLSPLQSYLSAEHVLLRLCVYTFALFIIEYMMGYLLEKVTGRCPWKYQSGLHVHGFIRLDYAPLWMGFCWLIETIYVFLNHLKLDLSNI